MDCCSVHLCEKVELQYVNQIRKDIKQQEKRRNKEEQQFQKELKKLKNKRKRQLSAIKKAVNKLEPKDRRKFRVFRTPSKVIIARKCVCKKRMLKKLRPCCCLVVIALAAFLAIALPFGP